MMNTPGSAGEPSCKRQENGDASTGSDRPLKKARFAWQVKGKYHLKNENNETKTSTIPNDPEKAGSSSQDRPVSDSLVGNTEQNLEILGDYLLKQDFNTLDSVITDSDKSLLKPSTNISPEKQEYPRYVSSFDIHSSGASSSSRNEQMSVPISMVVSNNYSEDQCIARWQARQMAKGFVDNTINRVLDSWMIAPLPTDMDTNRFLALDVAEFINNLPGDNSIENEGILMAISAHGLQNTSSSSSNNNSQNGQIRSSSTIKEVFSSLSSSPLQSDEEVNEPRTSNKSENGSNGGSCNDLQMAWSYDDDRNINSRGPFTYFPDTSSSSYHHYSDNDNLQNSNIELEDENAISNGNDILNGHFDFMDAAVSFAIQSKGLTSFGTDYG